jgi:hypothetical protein
VTDENSKIRKIIEDYHKQYNQVVDNLVDAVVAN